jgi:uncharacterized membrane protein
MVYLKLWLVMLPIFAIIDFIWLGLMSSTYDQALGSLARRSVQGQLSPYWPTGILAYLLLAAGPVFFVIPYFFDASIDWRVFVWGALFGLIVYGVYGFTNHAILAQWPAKLTFLDTMWGTFLYGISTFLTAWVARYFDII